MNNIEREKALEHARCPSCGDRVFTPRPAIVNAMNKMNGESEDINNPTVWCVDHGHWTGKLGECSNALK